MKLYNVVAYHDNKRFCIVAENLTEEEVNIWFTTHAYCVNNWTYYTEEVAQ